MKTKIANALTYFLLIICLVLLIFLAGKAVSGENRETSGTSRRTPTVRAIEKVMPAVVNLNTSSGADRTVAETRKISASGSGSIIDSSGLVLTNLHVIDGAEKISVTLSSGMVCQADVIAEDPENDIALLKLKDPPVILPVIPLMRPWRLLLGETVIAVGNPYGLDGTVTIGILSGINRSLADGSRLLFSDLLQTDAAIFPGNSGGPLINLDGCMIGMNMAVKRNAPGISFAVPLHRIENVLAKYMLPERMLNLNFGIVPEIDNNGKVTVSEVFPGSPADRAGIGKGMEILSFQGWNPENDLLSLSRRLIRLKPEIPVPVRLSGAGTVSVKPTVFSEEDGIALARWKLGIRVEKLNEKTAAALRYPFRSGIIVSGVVSPEESPFHRGDYLAEWNGIKIDSAETLGRALKSPAIGSEGTMTVYSLASDSDGRPFLERRTLKVRIE